MYCGVYNMYRSKIYNNNTKVDVGGGVGSWNTVLQGFYIIYDVM